MKRYEFKVVIEEGDDEFWESFYNRPGCDEVLELLREILYSYGGLDEDNCEVLLTKFIDDGEIGFGLKRPKIEVDSE